MPPAYAEPAGTGPLPQQTAPAFNACYWLGAPQRWRRSPLFPAGGTFVPSCWGPTQPARYAHPLRPSPYPACTIQSPHHALSPARGWPPLTPVRPYRLWAEGVVHAGAPDESWTIRAAGEGGGQPSSLAACRWPGRAGARPARNPPRPRMRSWARAPEEAQLPLPFSERPLVCPQPLERGR